MTPTTRQRPGRLSRANDYQTWARRRKDAVAEGTLATLRALDKVRYLIRQGDLTAAEAIMTVRAETVEAMAREFGAVTDPSIWVGDAKQEDAA